MVKLGAGMIMWMMVDRPVPKIASWATYVKRTCMVAPSSLLLCVSAPMSSAFEEANRYQNRAIQRA